MKRKRTSNLNNMPFNADTRCGLYRVELNECVILEELENMLEKTYQESDYNEKGNVFGHYVIEIEDAFNYHINSKANIPIDFWDWFNENYDNVYSWNAIEDEFVNENDDECVDESEDECVDENIINNLKL